jgi:hypothetical protein
MTLPRCSIPALFLLIISACSSPPRSAIDTIPLITTRDDGVADSQVVPIRLEGREVWLALDTGAPFTFLFSEEGDPEFVEHAGTIVLGDEEWDVPAYGDDAIGVEEFQGKPIVGVLGLDFFLETPTAIDYPGGELVRYQGGELPAGDAKLPRLPLGGGEHRRALVEVEIDGESLTMMFDTGAHDTFWLGVAGKSEDEISEVQTADGDVWEVSVGSGSLELPGEAPRAIPVMRALEIGYLSEEFEEIGADGLLGLTAIGWRRVVLDFAEGVILFGPREP